MRRFIAFRKSLSMCLLVAGAVCAPDASAAPVENPDVDVKAWHELGHELGLFHPAMEHAYYHAVPPMTTMTGKVVYAIERVTRDESRIEVYTANLNSWEGGEIPYVDLRRQHSLAAVNFDGENTLFNSIGIYALRPPIGFEYLA